MQTRFATTELALLLAHLGEDIDPDGGRGRPGAGRELPAELLAAGQFTFLGTGWTCGLASEAALKLREAAGLWTEAYPAMEYRHGPIAVTGRAASSGCSARPRPDSPTRSPRPAAWPGSRRKRR